MLATVLMAVVMAAVSVAASWGPFLVHLSPEKLDSLSYISSGIILGTAFALVLPECYEAFETPTFAGALILLGFMGMLLLENVLHAGAQADAESQSAGDSDNNDTAAFDVRRPNTWFTGMSLSTIGMTIHAAADGIALGVTQGSSQLIVFFAILMHKAPAAFGLTAVLLSEKKQSISQIKRDVVLFGLAGPVLAIVLALICFVLGFHAKEGDSSLFAASGLALSGGTFVYVAIHLLQKSEKSYQKCGLVTLGFVLPIVASLLHD